MKKKGKEKVGEEKLIWDEEEEKTQLPKMTSLLLKHLRDNDETIKAELQN